MSAYRETEGVTSMGKTIDLTEVSERLGTGLLQGPRGSDWDPDTVLYGCDEDAEFGVVDGWRWATDRATALAERAEDADPTEWRDELGRHVVKIATECGATPHDPCREWDLVLGAVALLGGHAVTQLGYLDMGRVRDAVYWVAGDPCSDEEYDQTLRVHLVLDAVGVLRISYAGRFAAVMKCGERDGDFVPHYDLPLLMTDATHCSGTREGAK